MSEGTLLYRLKGLEKFCANATRLVKDIVQVFPDARKIITGVPFPPGKPHQRSMHIFATPDAEFLIDALYYVRADSENGGVITAVDVQVRNEDMGLLRSYKHRIEDILRRYRLGHYEAILADHEPMMNERGVLV